MITGSRASPGFRGTCASGKTEYSAGNGESIMKLSTVALLTMAALGQERWSLDQLPRLSCHRSIKHFGIARANSRTHRRTNKKRR